MTKLNSSSDLSIGQVVWLGEPDLPTRKTTWTITGLHSDDAGLVYATIRSGQSGQSRVVPAERLVPFRAAEGAS